MSENAEKLKDTISEILQAVLFGFNSSGIVGRYHDASGNKLWSRVYADIDAAVDGARSRTRKGAGVSEIKTEYSQSEIIRAAKEFLLAAYGHPAGGESGDRWFERYGLLISFLVERFPIDDAGAHKAEEGGRCE